jgi:4-aminobutyrate aminotransferase-like enzyme
LFPPLCIKKNRIQSTWNGDPAKLLTLKEILKVIDNEQLVENVRDAGQSLLDGLKQLQVRLFSRKYKVSF